MNLLKSIFSLISLLKPGRGSPTVLLVKVGKEYKFVLQLQQQQSQ
jgi:hypothetical protein